MKKIATVEILKNDEKTKETINYFVTEDLGYGIKIQKGKEERDIPNISRDETTIKNIVAELIDAGNDLTQISYMVEDCAYNQNKQEAV